MASRLELHAKLVDKLGSNNVYFQPPESLKMQYPCIIYTLSGIDTVHADNDVYLHTRQYEVTLVSFDPDNEIVDKILELPMTSFTRRFTSDNLYHDVFKTYF